MTIPIHDNDVDYTFVFKEYLVKNKPFILGQHATSNWQSRTDFVTEKTKLNIEFLNKNFGYSSVPVTFCKPTEDFQQSKSDWILSAYLDYMQGDRQSGCYYLKDWHFQKEHREYTAYTTPIYFASDWLNEFWDACHDGDDYRFLYLGPAQSSTPFHADVFHSFSWSANVCGTKKWIIFPEGAEEKLRDNFNRMPSDVSDIDALDQAIIVTQGPGEIIYIPSGWHHQVHNLEDTLSINHNWINACNIAHCWEFLKQSLQDVEKEIADCKKMNGWHGQCQMILKANNGMNYKDFYTLCLTIANRRILLLETSSHTCNNMKGATRSIIPNNDHTLSCTKTPTHCTQYKHSICNTNSDEFTKYILQIGLSTNILEHQYLCTKFDSTHPCHFVFDLVKIMPVLKDVIHQSNFTHIDSSSCEYTPLVLMDLIIETLSKYM